MDLDPTIRIVVAEAEPHSGILSSFLEREGFDVAGVASSDGDLLPVLARVRPGVIVVDAGISATAALGARRYGALVVVWPKDVALPGAEERVDPDRLFEELPDAVRRAASRRVPRGYAHRGPDLVVVPDVDEEADPVVSLGAGVGAGPVPRRPRRSPRRAALSAAALFLAYAIAASAFAAGVTGGLVAMGDGSDTDRRPPSSQSSRPDEGESSTRRDATTSPDSPGDDAGPSPARPDRGGSAEPASPDEPGLPPIARVDEGYGGLEGGSSDETESEIHTNGGDGGDGGDGSGGDGGNGGQGHGNADGEHGNGGEHGGGNGNGNAHGNGSDDPDEPDPAEDGPRGAGAGTRD